MFSAPLYFRSLLHSDSGVLQFLIFQTYLHTNSITIMNFYLHIKYKFTATTLFQNVVTVDIPFFGIILLLRNYLGFLCFLPLLNYRSLLHSDSGFRSKIIKLSDFYHKISSISMPLFSGCCVPVLECYSKAFKFRISQLLLE